MSIDQAFNKTVEYYDSWIRKAVPGYDELFAAAGELVPVSADEPVEVLDLGAGTGLFSKLVMEKRPRGRFVLWDVAEKMLDMARERFGDFQDRFEFVVGDYRDLRDKGRFDLVISSLSIHHLSDAEKKELFRRIFGALREGGVFINVDLVLGPTPSLEEFYWQNWLGKIRSAGAPEEEVRAGIERRQAFDRDASMEDQLLWLREAGFSEVDCVYRNFKMGVFYAAKSS